jgi:hypothetical protein
MVGIEATSNVQIFEQRNRSDTNGSVILKMIKLSELCVKDMPRSGSLLDVRSSPKKDNPDDCIDLARPHTAANGFIFIRAT